MCVNALASPKEAVSSAVRFFPPSHACLPGRPLRTPHTLSLRAQVMYTHQKLKKQKTWQDGFLHVADDFARASLFDSTNKNKIDSTFLSGPVNEQDDLETEKFLVQVGELHQAGPQPATSSSTCSSSTTKAAIRPPPPLRTLNSALSRPFQPPSSLARPVASSTGISGRATQFSLPAPSSTIGGTACSRHNVTEDHIDASVSSTFAPKRSVV